MPIKADRLSETDQVTNDPDSETCDAATTQRAGMIRLLRQKLKLTNLIDLLRLIWNQRFRPTEETDLNHVSHWLAETDACTKESDWIKRNDVGAKESDWLAEIDSWATNLTTCRTGCLNQRVRLTGIQTPEPMTGLASRYWSLNLWPLID